MKHSCYAVIALCLFLVVQETITQDRAYGLSVIISKPTGIGVKVWILENTVFDFGIGWSIGWYQIWKFKENFNENTGIRKGD